MYESFFGFDHRPFALLPDSDCIFWTEGHRNAFSVIEVGLQRLSQVLVLTGGIGTGKTTLIRQLLRTTMGTYSVGLVSNFMGDRGDILRWALAAFGQDMSDAESDAVLVARFEQYLTGQLHLGRRSVLIIDEAQNLSNADLENLRLLSNLNRGEVLLMLVLVGQPQLRAKLTRVENRQICQRIGADYHLDALTPEDTKGYVRFRCRQAGGSEDLFAEAALDEICRVSRGIPRKINVLCDLALASAHTEEALRVSEDIVRSVLEDARRRGTYTSLTEDDVPAIVERDLAVGAENDPVAPASASEGRRDPLQRLSVVLEDSGQGTSRFGSGARHDKARLLGRTERAPANDGADSTFEMLHWPDDALLFIDDPQDAVRKKPAPVEKAPAAAPRTDTPTVEPIRPSSGSARRATASGSSPAGAAGPVQPRRGTEPPPAPLMRSRRFWSGGRARTSSVGAQLEPLRTAARRDGWRRRGWRSANGVLEAVVNGSLLGGLVLLAFAGVAAAPRGPEGPPDASGSSGSSLAGPPLDGSVAAPAAEAVPASFGQAPAGTPDQAAALTSGQAERKTRLLVEGWSTFVPATPAHEPAAGDAPFVAAEGAEGHGSAPRDGSRAALAASPLAPDHLPEMQQPQGRPLPHLARPLAMAEPAIASGRPDAPGVETVQLRGVARSAAVSALDETAAPRSEAAVFAAVPGVRLPDAAPLDAPEGETAAAAQPVAVPAEEQGVRTVRSAALLGTPAMPPQGYAVPSSRSAAAEPAGEPDRDPPAAAGAGAAAGPAQALDPDAIFRHALEIAIDRPAAAAVAYARAALMGHERAAYYLGQIYETGDGVPIDFALARHWYDASAASNRRARARLRELPDPETGGTLASPVPLSATPSLPEHADFVWTSGRGADPTAYIVEMAVDPAEGAAVAHHVDGSAARLPLPPGAGYWRVLALDMAAGRYAVSEWQPIGTSDAPQPIPALGEEARLRPSVTIAFSGGAAADAAALRASLREKGISVRLSEEAAAGGRGSSVRYFYGQDEASADAIAELVGADVTASMAPPPGEEAAPLPGQVLVTLGSL